MSAAVVDPIKIPCFAVASAIGLSDLLAFFGPLRA
jgi:hypothetical protein